MTTSPPKLELIGLKLDADNPAEAKAKLRELVEAGRVKIAEIKRFTGFESSTVSAALNDRYQGDVAKLDDALLRFYRNWTARFAIVQTGVVEEIHATLALTWKRRTMGLVVGRFGRGKTTAAKTYVALHPDHAVYLVLHQSTTRMGLLDRLAEVLDVQSSCVGRFEQRIGAIIRALQRRPRLIVVDEADELRPPLLNILRNIHGEDDDERCAIAFLSTDRLIKMLRTPELGYMRSRIKIKRGVEDVALDEAVKIAAKFQHDLHRADLAAAWEWSMRREGLRTFTTLLQRASDEAQLHNEKTIDTDALDRGYGWLID